MSPEFISNQTSWTDPEFNPEAYVERFLYNQKIQVTSVTHSGYTTWMI